MLNKIIWCFCCFDNGLRALRSSFRFFFFYRCCGETLKDSPLLFVLFYFGDLRHIAGFVRKKSWLMSLVFTVHTSLFPFVESGLRMSIHINRLASRFRMKCEAGWSLFGEMESGAATNPSRLGRAFGSDARPSRSRVGYEARYRQLGDSTWVWRTRRRGRGIDHTVFIKLNGDDLGVFFLRQVVEAPLFTFPPFVFTFYRYLSTLCSVPCGTNTKSSIVS